MFYRKNKNKKNKVFFKRNSETQNAVEANNIQWLNFQYSRKNLIIRKILVNFVIIIILYI